MIKEIAEGHLDEFLGVNKELAEKRMEICKKCPEIKYTQLGAICNICKCRLNAKTRLPYIECPIKKWVSE